jgi:hexosaminidase
VQVVPEIEMPGHAQAAIAAYPKLGAGSQPLPVSSNWGVHTHLFNLEPQTFRFLEDVLDEVMQLFPSRYVHVGGDEAVKDEWNASAEVQTRARELHIHDADALQSYFTQKIGRYLAAHGRRLVGWDEILTPGLPTDAIVMSWRGPIARQPPAMTPSLRRNRRCTSTAGKAPSPANRRAGSNS